jgi:hypothetical protein
MKKTIAALALGMASLGYSDTPRAGVKCDSGGDGLICSVTHERGNDTVKVCWAVRLDCRGRRPITSARKCVEALRPSSRVQVNMTDRDFPGIDSCDIAGAGVDNLTVQ